MKKSRKISIYMYTDKIITSSITSLLVAVLKNMFDQMEDVKVDLLSAINDLKSFEIDS